MPVTFGRWAPSASGRTVMSCRSMLCPKSICTHWPTELSLASATHAVARSSSKAAEGPWAESSVSGEDENDEAETLDAPSGSATV